MKVTAKRKVLILKNAEEFGVPSAAKKFNVSAQTIYNWKTKEKRESEALKTDVVQTKPENPRWQDLIPQSPYQRLIALLKRQNNTIQTLHAAEHDLSEIKRQIAEVEHEIKFCESKK